MQSSATHVSNPLVQSEEAFRRDPTDLAAFAALRDAYEAQARTADLADLCEQHALAIDENERAAALLCEAAAFHRSGNNLGAEQRALEQASALAPDYRPALTRRQRLAESQHHWSELAELLAQEASILRERPGDVRAAAEVNTRLADLCEHRLHRLDLAVTHYETAIALAPGLLGAAQPLRKIYQACGRWTDAERLYLTEIAAAKETGQRVSYLVELAEMRRHRMFDLPAADRAYQEALQLDRNSDLILRATAELRAAPEWPEPGGPEDATEIFLQLARRAGARGETNVALDDLRRALGATPDSHAAFEQLTQALEQAKRWHDLDRILQQRIALLDEAPEAAELQIRRAMLAQEQLADLPRARACYERAVTRQGAGIPVAHRLRQVYLEMGDAAAAVGLIRQTLDATEDPPARIRLMMDLAAIYRDDLDNSEAAAEMLHEVLQIDPEHRKAFAAYEDYFRRKGDFQSLAELLRFSAQSAVEAQAPATEICARLEELADVCERRLGDLPGAADAWQQIAALHPDDDRPRRALQQLGAKMVQLRELADRLQHEVDRATSESERSRGLRKMAEVFHERQIDLAATVEMLQEILDHDPHDEGALTMLVDLYEREGNADGLAWALTRQLKGILTRQERLRTLRRLGDTYADRLHAPAEAAAMYEQLLELSPHDDAAFDRLCDILRQDDDLPRLAETLRRRLQSAHGEVERTATLRMLAPIVDQIGDPEEAIAHWEEVLALCDGDREAVAALARLYRNAGRDAELLDILRRQLRQIGDDESGRGVEVLREIADIAENRLDQRDEALIAHEQLGRLLPADRRSLAARATLYEALGRHGELLSLLEQQIALSPDTEEQLGLASKAIDLLVHELEDPERAAALYERILDELAPADLETHRRLRTLYRHLAQFERAALVAERELFLLPTTPEARDARLELAREIAQLWWHNLHEAEPATAAYERLVELDPEDPTALQALRTLYPHVGAPTRHVALGAALERVLEDDVDRRALWLELAKVWETQLGDAPRAFGYYQRAYRAAPPREQGSLLQQMEGVAEAHRLWEELLGVYGEARQRLRDHQTLGELLRRMAALCQHQLRDGKRALYLLAEAVALDGADRALLTEIEALATNTALEPELIACYQQIAATTDQPERAVDLLGRAARVALDSLGDQEQALDLLLLQLHRALATRRDTPSALLETIEKLATTTNDVSAVAAAHHEQLLHHTSPEDSLAILHHLADLFEQPFDESQRVFEALLRALLLTPEDEALRARLAQLARKLDASGSYDEQMVTLFTAEEIARIPARWDHCRRPRSIAQPPPAPISAVDSTPEGDEPIELSLSEILDAEDLSDVPSPPPLPSTPSTVNRHALLEPPATTGRALDRLTATYRALKTTRTEQTIDRLLEVAALWNESDATQADHLQQALGALREAAALDLRDDRALRRLEDLAREHQRLDEVSTTYDQLIAHCPSSEALLRLHLRAGIFESERGHRDQAARHFEAALTLDPMSEAAADGLRDVYAGEGKWENLAALLQRQLEALGDTMTRTERRRHLTELAEVCDVHLGKPLAAAQWITRMLEEAPAHEPYLTKLARIYRQQGIWSRYVETLRSLISATEDPRQRASYGLEIGRTYDVELELPHDAITAYREVLDSPDGSQADRAQAFAGLARLYRQHQQRSSLITLLRRHIDASGAEQDDARNLLLELATLLEQEERAGEAAEALLRARTLGPCDAALDCKLAELWTKTGASERAIALLTDRIEDAEHGDLDAPSQIALRVRLALIESETLGDDGRAAATLRRAVALGPEDTTALAHLATVELRLEAWDAYAATIRQWSQALADASAGRRLRQEAADALRVRSPGAAASLLGELLSEEPENGELVDALLELERDPEQRQTLLRRKIELTDSREEKANALVALAELEHRAGVAMDSVRERLQLALELQPGLVGAVEHLALLEQHAGNLDRALKLVTDALARTDETANSSVLGILRLRLAEIHQALDRTDEAYEHLLAARRARPQDLPIRIALGENRFAARRWREAVRHLAAAGDHPDAEQHALMVANALYHAGLCERQLHRADGALTMFEAAHRIDNRHPGVLRELADATIARGRDHEGARLLRALSDVVEAPSERIALLARAAEIYRKRLAEPEVAADCYEAASALLDVEDDGNIEPAETRALLEQMLPPLREAGRHRAVARVSRSLVELSDESEDQRDNLLSAAEAYAALREWEQADDLLRRTLALDPRCRTAVHLLTRSLVAQGETEQAIQLLQHELPGIAPSDDAIEQRTHAQLYALLGSLQQRHGDTQQAVAAFERSLEIVDDHEARRTLAQLYGAEPRWRAAAVANHRALARDVANVDALGAYGAAIAEESPERARCLYQVLDALGHLDDAGRELLAQHGRPELAVDARYEGTLDLTDHHNQLDVSPNAGVREILLALWEATPGLLALGLAELGLSAEDRIPLLGRSRLAQVYGAIARAIGITTVGLYAAPAHATADNPEVRIAPVTPPAIIVRRELLESSPVDRLRFVLGRAAALSGPPLVLAAGLEPSRFAALLTAILRAFHPRYAREVEEEIMLPASAVREKVPHRTARRLSTLFREHPELSFDSAAWRRAALMTANRTGLLLCGNLKVAVAELRRVDASLDEALPMLEAIQRSPLLHDLLTFAASDAYFSCRQQLWFPPSTL